MRGKWTEHAGRIITAEERPRFSVFLQFVKDRENLVNNEFWRGPVASPSKEKRGNEQKRGRSLSRVTTLATKVKPNFSKKLSRHTEGVPHACAARQAWWLA